MDIVSYVEDGKDVINHLIDVIQEERISLINGNVLIKRIRAYINLFLLCQHPDGDKIKCVEWSIYEIRIKISGTWYLCRIFFHREKNKIILITSCLLKPGQYGDKKMIAYIGAQYAYCIKKSHEIVQDYMTTQKYEYGFISLSST